MSYIRCTSNPEGLYVYHSVEGTICWHGNGMETTTHIPANIFYKFVRLMPNWSADYERGSLEIKEVLIPSKKKLNKDLQELRKLGFKLGTYKIILYYKGIEVARMWPVTWKYIYDGVMRDIKNKKPE